MVFMQFSNLKIWTLSKLSENHKINVIRLTELKLWLFKDSYLILLKYSLSFSLSSDTVHKKVCVCVCVWCVWCVGVGVGGVWVCVGVCVCVVCV